MINEDSSNKTSKELRTIAIEVEGRVYSVDLDLPRIQKELCFFLKKSRGYLSAMKKAGFIMPMDLRERREMATIASVFKWLEQNPDFTFNAVYRK
jgi:hypothetical protein